MSTIEVTSLIRWQLNRWLFLVIVSSQRVTDTIRYSAATVPEQLGRSALTAALLELAALTANSGFLDGVARLARDRYTIKRSGRSRRGFALRRSLRQYALPYLPKDMINWLTLAFRTDVLPLTAWGMTLLPEDRETLRQMQCTDHQSDLLATVRTSLAKGARPTGPYWNHHYHSLPQAVRQNFEVLYQLIAQQYAVYILRCLGSFLPGLAHLSARQRLGFEGLSYGLITRAVERELIFSTARAPR